MSINNNVNIADEIKSRCNIVDVIGRVVPLKKAGSNYKGICPFHNEKTPSFVVSETKQIFTCFGCGATGDVLTFVMRYYNIEFRAAVEMLAKEYGIDIRGAFKSSGDKEQLYELNRLAARFFYRALRQRANPGYTYMKERGIDEETMNRFGIGYADAQWDSLFSYLKEQGIEESRMLELGLVSKSGDGRERYFDKFRNRVIFPIMNTGGKVIGFGGRIIGKGEPKYLNSPESAVFLKKNNLYGLNLTGREVRNNDAIILVEGYMDVVSLYQSGVRNVSASLGTALTENQARLIRRYTKNVILSYDADAAGKNAALRGLDILYGADCRARVLTVTDGKDPDEFIKKNGKKAFIRLVENARPYGDFKLDMAKAKYDIEKEQDRIEFLREAVDIIRAMKPVEADIYIKKLALETGISEGAIRFEYSGNTIQEKGRGAVSFSESQDMRSKGEYDAERLPLIEQDLIRLMLMDHFFSNIPEDIAENAFSSSICRDIYSAVRSTGDDGRPPDMDKLRSMLDEPSLAALEEIEKRVIPPGSERAIFDTCIRQIRKQALKRQEEEILIRLSMADEDKNHDEIVRLTQQLIEIQKKTRN